jgi:hypothetical protein
MGLKNLNHIGHRTHRFSHGLLLIGNKQTGNLQSFCPSAENVYAMEVDKDTFRFLSICIYESKRRHVPLKSLLGL